MAFQRDIIKVFCDHIRKLSATIKDKKKVEEFIISETMILYFIRMLDLFALLDALKNMKASLNNDFSLYKRYFFHIVGKLVSLIEVNRVLGFIRKNEDQTQDNNILYLFLANQNSITTNLKTELQQIDSYVISFPLAFIYLQTWYPRYIT